MAADDDNRSNRSVPQESPSEGRLEAPRDTSPRQAPTKAKKVYPPGPPGKVLIFRTLHGRVVPMWVDP
jgi:hypothetical protein